MGVSEDLVMMGFEPPLAKAAAERHPADMERAADFCLNPPPDWATVLDSQPLPFMQQRSNSTADETGQQQQQQQQQQQEGGEGGERGAMPTSAARSSSTGGTMNSSANILHAPRSEHASLPLHETAVTLRPDYSDMSSQPSTTNNNNDDDDLARAIAMSMESSTTTAAAAGAHGEQQQQQQQAAGDGGSSGPWPSPSAQYSTDDWTPHQSDDWGQLHAAAQATHNVLTSSSAAARLKTHSEQGLPPLHHQQQQPRQDMTAPLALCASAQLLACLPTLVQALYASRHFRNALLALPLPYDHPSELSFTDYWRGAVSEPASSSSPPSQGDSQGQLQLLKALQRCFVYLRHSRRQHLTVTDLAVALAPAFNSSNSRVLENWSNPVVAVDALRLILDAWKNVVPQLQLVSHSDEPSSDVPHYWERLQGVPFVKGRAGPSPASPDAPEIGEDVIGLVPLEVVAETTHLVQAMQKTFHITGSWISRPPESLMVSLDRRGLPQDQTHVVQLPATLSVGQFMWEHRHKVLGKLSEADEIHSKKATLVEEKDKMRLHQGNDVCEALEKSLRYFDKHAIANDDAHHAKQTGMKQQLQSILDQLRASIAAKEAELAQISKDMSAMFDDDVDLQAPDYAFELTGIVSWTGFESVDMMFAYFKGDDGRWFKQLDNRVEETNEVAALEDLAGSWMKAGPYILVYSRESVEPVAESEGPPALVDAVQRDNHVFKAELDAVSPTLAEGWGLPERPQTPPQTQIHQREGEAAAPMQLDSVSSTPARQEGEDGHGEHLERSKYFAQPDSESAMAGEAMPQIHDKDEGEGDLIVMSDRRDTS